MYVKRTYREKITLLNTYTPPTIGEIMNEDVQTSTTVVVFPQVFVARIASYPQQNSFRNVSKNDDIQVTIRND